MRGWEIRSKGNGGEVWVLEVLWYNSVKVLEGHCVQVQSPESQCSLVANGAKLNMCVFNIRVHFNLVDCMWPDESTLHNQSLVQVPNCHHVFSLDTHWYKILWVVWESKCLNSFLMECQSWYQRYRWQSCCCGMHFIEVYQWVVLDWINWSFCNSNNTFVLGNCKCTQLHLGISND